MHFSIHYSTILPMLELCKKLKKGTLKEEELRQLLKHDDYQFEFSRYAKRITEEEFIDYFLSLPGLNEDSITNGGLKWHHKHYLYLLDHLDLFIAKEKELPGMLKQDMIQEQINHALSGLPDDLELPDLNYYITIGIGPSHGYVHGSGMGFDFIQLVEGNSIETLCSMIAHETHHVGTGLIYKEIDFAALPLEAAFYLYFAGEGLAVKYCNNAEGILSKSIHSGPKNIGLDSFTWEYLNNDFDATMTQFKETIDKLRHNGIKSLEELEKHINEYWMNPLTKEQKPGKIPKLMQLRLYSFGNDLWGLIHDCFGKDVVYATFRHPQNFPSVFNKALQQIGRTDLQI